MRRIELDNSSFSMDKKAIECFKLEIFKIIACGARVIDINRHFVCADNLSTIINDSKE